jgi:hypothetical protein
MRKIYPTDLSNQGMDLPENPYSELEAALVGWRGRRESRKILYSTSALYIIVTLRHS